MNDSELNQGCLPFTEDMLPTTVRRKHSVQGQKCAPMGASWQGIKLFYAIPDTVPSSEPMALGILDFLVRQRHDTEFWRICERACAATDAINDLVLRRYEYRICLGLMALLIKGMVYQTRHETIYKLRSRYQVSALGTAIAEKYALPRLEDIMTRLDDMRGYSEQTSYLKGLDIAEPVTSVPEQSQPDHHEAPSTDEVFVLDGSSSLDLANMFHSQQATGTRRLETGVPSPTIAQLLNEPFDFTELTDERQKVYSKIVERQGQDTFREALIAIQGGRCAMTGCTVIETLQAAHIISYRGKKTNHPANGLLLRADIHLLFDRGLITVDTGSMQILVAPALMQTEYKTLDQQPLMLSQAATNISLEALDAHRFWATHNWNRQKLGDET